VPTFATPAHSFLNSILSPFPFPFPLPMAVSLQNQPHTIAGARVKKSSVKEPRSREQTRLAAQASSQVAMFLKGFINEDEMGPNVRRVWREKTYMQRFLDMPPDMATEEQAAGVTAGGGLGTAGIGGIAVMYTDPGLGLERVMFRGVEWDLLIWDMLLYCLTDYLAGGNPVLAGLVTYLVARGVVLVRTQFGQTNIANKTLVDDRFLD
jgi:hypothetical protein